MQRGVSLSIVALTAALALPCGLSGATRASAQDASGASHGGASSGGATSGGDARALDALGPVAGAKTGPHRASPRRAVRHGHPVRAATAKPAAVAPSPVIPAAPPPPPVIKAPVIDVPLHPEPPPPPVPVVASAAGAPSQIESGARLTFGSGSADLNRANMQALQAFTVQLKADPQARAQINAFGEGTADDPSTPRRMSLARGLAARAVLINGGVASTRIYVRAIGQPHDGGPADRIDVTRSDAVPPTPATSPAPAPAPAPAAAPAPALAPASDPTPDHAQAASGKAATAP